MVALFLVGVGLTSLVSGVVVWYLQPYLRGVLVDLCGTAPRAAFWTAFSNVTIGVTPILFAMHYRPSAPPAPGVFELGSQLEWALAGLLLSVVLLGTILSRYIPRGRES